MGSASGDSIPSFRFVPGPEDRFSHMKTRRVSALERCVLLAGLYASSLPAMANFLDGNELRERCAADSPDAVNTCMGYIAGVADAEDAGPSWRMQESLFCVPRGVSGGQLRRAVLDHLSAHPEEEDLNAAIVVGNAFLERFPCSE